MTNKINSYMDDPEFGRYKNYLVDRDGTLFATCLANYEAYEQSLSQFGIKINTRMSGGFHEGLSWPVIASKYYPSLNQSQIKQIQKLKTSLFREHIEKIEINSGILDIIKDRNWFLVTNATEESTRSILQKFSLEHDFMHLSRSNLNLRPKPAPDLFVHAIETLKLNPVDTIVIEDSTIGEIAAIGAGLEVVRINHFCNLIHLPNALD